MADDIITTFFSIKPILLECRMKVRRDHATFQLKTCDMDDVIAFAGKMKEDSVRKINKEVHVSCTESLSQTQYHDPDGVLKQGRLRFHTSSIALDMSFEIDSDNNVTFTDHNTHESIHAKFTPQ